MNKVLKDSSRWMQGILGRKYEWQRQRKGKGTCLFREKYIVLFNWLYAQGPLLVDLDLVWPCAR